MTLQSSSVIVLQVHAEGNGLLAHTVTTDGLERPCQLRTITLVMSSKATADSSTALGALFCCYNKMVSNQTGQSGNMFIDIYSLADWFWCRGEPFGTCKLDSQLRLFLTGSGTWAAMDERVRLGRLRRNFSETEKARNGGHAKCSEAQSVSQLTLVLHHIGLQVMAVALQRVARLLQAADDGLRGTSAVAVVNRTGRGAGAWRVSRRGAGRVSWGGAEAIGGQMEGWVHGLLFILQAVGIQLLVTKGAAPQ